MTSAKAESGALLASQPALSSLSLVSAVASEASSASSIFLTIDCGVPLGTTIPNHGVTWALAKPCSARVGASGNHLRITAIADPGDIDARFSLEQLEAEVPGRALAG